MKTKAIIYTRVSTDKQTSASQVRELREYAERQGWGQPEIIEDTASGGTFTRTGFDKLMDRVRNERVKVVLAYKLDRLGRSLPHLATIIDEMLRHGVALVIPGQGIDTSDRNPAAKLQTQILMAVAEFEREIIRDRVNAGLAAAKAKGVKLGRPATLHKHKADVERLAAEGMSGRKIAATLGIPKGSAFLLLREYRKAA
jgi:DNA invertase Pin-like site-specific DNA recombinase